MLQSGTQIRLTPAEIDEARDLGIDLAGVKSKDDYAKAVIRLVTTLEQECPSLLEKVAKALAEKTGAKLPARLTQVP